MPDRSPATTRPRLGSPRQALDLLAAVATSPPRHETIAVALDAHRSALGIAVIAATSDPDAVLTVAEFLAAELARPSPTCAVVIATVRPRARPDPADARRWSDACSGTLR